MDSHDGALSFLAQPCNRLLGMTADDLMTPRNVAPDVDRRNAMLGAIAHGAASMARSPDWREAIEELLERLGKAAQVSRAYLFEVDDRPGGPFSQACTYDWAAPGLAPLVGEPGLSGWNNGAEDEVFEE